MTSSGSAAADAEGVIATMMTPACFDAANVAHEQETEPPAAANWYAERDCPFVSFQSVNAVNEPPGVPPVVAPKWHMANRKSPAAAVIEGVGTVVEAEAMPELSGDATFNAEMPTHSVICHVDACDVPDVNDIDVVAGALKHTHNSQRVFDTPETEPRVSTVQVPPVEVTPVNAPVDVPPVRDTANSRVLPAAPDVAVNDAVPPVAAAMEPDGWLTGPVTATYAAMGVNATECAVMLRVFVLTHACEDDSAPE
jgi:hypothetical protein